MKQCETIKNDVLRVIAEVHQKKPMIECLTNTVTIGDCANIILASGASPIMAEDIREIDEIVSAAGAVVINIGTLKPEMTEAMLAAGKKANEVGVPVILDPVGAGASKLRNDVSAQLLEQVKFQVIRGNMSEIRALAGFTSQTKGVDAGGSDAASLENIEASVSVVRQLSEKLGCAVAATGALDIIAAGDTAYAIQNGHPMLEDVTGTGCMTSSLAGSYCGAGLNLPVAEAITAVLVMCIAGEKAQEFAAKHAEGGIGTFREKLFDYVYTLSEQDIKERGKIYEL